MTWHSHLTLAFDRDAPDIGQVVNFTHLTQREHIGALRVQKALYPEGAAQQGICHVIMLYPPAGLAIGDELTIDIGLNNTAQAVVTTPGANKWYGTLPSYSAANHSSKNLPDKEIAINPKCYATQNVNVYLQDNSRFEWLPQENCFYNTSHARSANQFFLSPNASLMAWEINLLGREYHGERYDIGSLQLSNLFWRVDGGKRTLLLADPLGKSANEDWFVSQVGLNKHKVFATLWVVPTTHQLEAIADWVKQLRLFIENNNLPLCCTQTGDVLIIRYLGGDVRQCFDAFGAIRGKIRQLMWQQNNHLPRIWAT